MAVFLAAPAAAAPLALDCTAQRACVADLDAACETIGIIYALDVGADEGDKVVLTTGEGERFYEFRRLAGAEGVLLQAAGGALEPGQGAGAMTVFDDLRFVLSRHNRIALSEEDDDLRAVSISIHGTCAARQ
ncbi:hypothetical protein [Rhodovulum euryhalinum]|uniref:hypothetical protein n=1 Tax=Rhodovulum euryhalinum TaxID=35805 RepID=UPI00104DA280|nr:hypothetical protein [Rhodovulum euryhalinum]